MDSHRNCIALRGLNHLGAEGYHWRVCVEDKAAPGEPLAEKPSFSWWDVQDENAKLPVKQATQAQLSKLFALPSSSATSSSTDAAKVAKGAFKSLGKAMSQAVGTESAGDSGPQVPMVAFKLLDFVRMHDDFKPMGGHIPQPAAVRQTSVPRQNVSAAPPRRQQQTPATSSRPPVPRTHSQPARQTPAARAPQQEASLMDFGPASSSAGHGSLRHSHSSPPAANETKAQKLKREYTEKNRKANRVWDDVDQRWVEVDPKANSVSRGSTSAPPRSTGPVKKEKGISLDPANAVGKSASVQAAVNQRVNEMKDSQQKALTAIREREEKKKSDEAEEDQVRKRLEPKIKVWSEEHGKKKQLRALLGSLHTILWSEANWKPVSIGDILDDSKVKRCFHKASRVVHPDKTGHLDAEKRFLAKRIFDALSQAKTDFDNGAK